MSNTKTKIINELKKTHREAGLIAVRLDGRVQELHDLEDKSLLLQLAIGEDLHALKAELKEETGHGSFLTVAGAIFGKSDRRRQQFMQLAREWHHIRSDEVQALNFDDDGCVRYSETMDGQLALLRHYNSTRQKPAEHATELSSAEALSRSGNRRNTKSEGPAEKCGRKAEQVTDQSQPPTVDQLLDGIHQLGYEWDQDLGVTQQGRAEPLRRDRIQVLEWENANLEQKVAELEAENRQLKEQLREALNAKAPSLLDSEPQPPELRNPDHRLAERDRELLSKVYQQALVPDSPIAENAKRKILDICQRSGIHPTELRLVSGDLAGALAGEDVDLVRLLENTERTYSAQSKMIHKLERELAKARAENAKLKGTREAA